MTDQEPTRRSNLTITTMWTMKGLPPLRVLEACACFLLLSTGCAPQEPASPSSSTPDEPLFRMLSPQRTRIDFQNTLSEQPTPHRNELLYEYFSNGAGVAVGDVNGDGLDDLFFTGNMTYNRLYLNRGDMVFEDVTSATGVAGRKNTWKTGATMVDINGDGWLDLYVCYSGDLPLDRRIDEVLIHQGVDAAGVPRFSEAASEYGLAHPHSSNQAYFFDHDRDGDLDLFLLTHNVKRTPRRDEEGTQEQLAEEDPVNGVRFYRNDDGRFEDVTRRTGIQSSPLTYGLGASVSDLDNDGWLDIYMGNDYSPPDFLYINNGNGTFRNEIATRMGHTSNASMGIDIADINDDGWTDIIVLDMLAADHRRQKTLFIPEDRAMFEMFVKSGFHYQYMRNTLQLNNGDGTFSEIGQLAGVSNTDWSWTPLFADLDNDGRKDLFITNGILHDTIDRDFLAFKNYYIRSKGYDLEPADIAYLMDNMPSSALPNYAFKNEGGLRFRDVSADWGLNRPLKSTGAAYADLDNDGDLDLITNNINDYALVFENRSREAHPHHFLQIELKGAPGNTAGIGARVTVYTGDTRQYVEQMPARGYLSGVSPTLHVGLAGHAVVDSLEIVWPDGTKQTLRGIEADRRITVGQADAAPAGPATPPPAPFFAGVPAPVDFRHRMDEAIDDFRRQPLMVTAKSLVGPPVVRGDVNGDGLDDLFVGGGSDQAGRIYTQRPDGSFSTMDQPAFDADRGSHDAAALFFDASGDGFEDLYVASGGYGHFAPDDEALQDRLYINDGRGRFTRNPDRLPDMRTSTGAVAAADVDGDGDTDLFVGGYVVPGRYPEPPQSYLLMNDGRGRFTDRTADVAPGLQRIGMVNDARWADVNGDGAEELIVAGDWMPIRIFENAGGTLVDASDTYFDKPYTGLWNAVLVEDLDRDGYADLVAGNLGLNTQIRASDEQPAELFFGDFDNDGTVDPFLTFYLQGRRYPFVTLDELRMQMPVVASRFPSYAAYAGATIEEVLPGGIERAHRLEATTLETTLFMGSAGGALVRKPLPVEAQFSPIHALHALDYNGDGAMDLILAGNAGEARIRLGKNDANYGTLLRGDGNGSFTYVPQYASGFSIRGDVRSITGLGDTLLFGVHGDVVRAYRPVGE